MTPRERLAAVDWRGYAGFVCRGWGFLLGLVWLAVLGLLVAGFLVGPAPVDAADAPAVDTGDPPAAVAADAVEQLRYRDHTVAEWWRFENRSTGEVGGGIFYRLEISHEHRRIHALGYGGVYRDEWTAPTDSHGEVFAGSLASYDRSPGGPWQRAGSTRATYRRDVSSLGRTADVLRNADASVASENATTLVVVSRDPEVLEAYGVDPENDASVRFVVAKGEAAHLSRVVVSAQREEYDVRRTLVVTDVGSTDAAPPADVPPAPATGALARAVAGLERLFGGL